MRGFADSGNLLLMADADNRISPLLAFLEPICALIARVLFSTLRVTIVGIDMDRKLRRERGSAVIAIWHQDLLPIIFFNRHRGGGAMISQSKDGEIIARIVQRMGYVVARGSSSRGGKDALRTMVKFLKDGRTAGTPVDGPRGPAKEAKVGMVLAAKMSGRPIVPVACAAHPAIRGRNWDRTKIVLPFSKVLFLYGDPIDVPADANAEQIEAIRLDVVDALNELEIRAEKLFRDDVAGRDVEDSFRWGELV